MNPILQILKDLLTAVVKGVGADLTKNAPEVGQSGSRAPSPPPVRKATASPDKSPPSDPDDDFSWASRSTRKAFARNVAAFNQRKEESERKKPAPWLPSSMAAGVREAFSLASRDLKNRLWGKGRQRSATEQFSESTAKVAEKRPEPPPQVTPEEAPPKAPQEKPPYHPASIISGVKEAFSLVFGSRRRQSEISTSPKKSSRIDHLKQRQAILADMEKRRSEPEEEEEDQDSRPRTRRASRIQRLKDFGQSLIQSRKKLSIGQQIASASSPQNGGGQIQYGKIITMMGQPQGKVNAAKASMVSGGAPGGAAAGGLIRGALGMVGKAAGFIGALAVAAYASYKALVGFGESTLKSREYLSQFNGQISAAFSRLKAQEVRQNIQMGRATQNSTTALVDAMRDLNQSTQSSREALATVLNKAAEYSIKAATAMIEIAKQIPLLKDVADWIKGIEENTKKNPDGSLPLTEILEKLKTGKFTDTNTLPRL